MQIRPISPSFNGYVEVNCRQERNGRLTSMTFNTNAISFSPSLKNGKTDIYYGSQEYTADCPYDTFQQACLKSDVSGKIESAHAENEEK